MVSEFERASSARLAEFKNDHRSLDSVISDIVIPALPSPFDGIADKIYSSEKGDPEQKVKAVLDYMHYLGDQGEEHYEKIVSRLDSVLTEVSEVKIITAKESTLQSVKEILVSREDTVNQKLDELRTQLTGILEQIQMDMNQMLGWRREKETAAYYGGAFLALLTMAPEKMVERGFTPYLFIAICGNLNITLTPGDVTILNSLPEMDALSKSKFSAEFNGKISFALDSDILTAFKAGYATHYFAEDVLASPEADFKVELSQLLEILESAKRKLSPGGPVSLLVQKSIATFAPYLITGIPVGQGKSLASQANGGYGYLAETQRRRLLWPSIS